MGRIKRGIKRGFDWLKGHLQEDDPDLPAPLVPVALSAEARRMREEGEVPPDDELAVPTVHKPPPPPRGSVADRIALARARRR